MDEFGNTNFEPEQRSDGSPEKDAQNLASDHLVAQAWNPFEYRNFSPRPASNSNFNTTEPIEWPGQGQQFFHGGFDLHRHHGLQPAPPWMSISTYGHNYPAHLLDDNRGARQPVDWRFEFEMRRQQDHLQDTNLDYPDFRLPRRQPQQSDNEVENHPRTQRPSNTEYKGPRYPDGSTWTGSNFNTDGNASLSKVERGHTLEIDPFGHRMAGGDAGAKKYIRDAQTKGAKVVIYLPGGHVYTSPNGPDSLQQYTDARWTQKYGEPLKFGRTGAVWEDKGEKRVLDQSHPGFLARQEERMLDCFRLGANGVRYDNLHSPASGSKATEEQVLAVYRTFLRARERFQKEGGKSPEGGLGLVPHNSMPIWEKLLAEGKVNPRDILMLGLERTTQLSDNPDPSRHPEILSAINIARKYGFGLAVTNFQTERSKNAAGKTITFDLDKHYSGYQERVFKMLSDAGIVGQVTTVPDENNYYSFDSGGRKPATIRFTKPSQP